MIKGIKVMLIPNNKQRSNLFQCAGVSRFAYNWTLEKQKYNYKNGGKFIKDKNLRKEFTQLKKIEEFKWLNQYSNNITKQAIKDACDAYNKFFKGYSQFPRFKSRKKSSPKFYQDTDKIQFTDTHVKLEKLTVSRKKNRQKFNWIRLAEHIRIPYGEDIKYVNPRISFDGVNWWISVGVECSENDEFPSNEGIGVDLGVKDLAICSDIDKPYKNINKNKKVKKIKKRLCRLQRRISKKYEMNREGSSYKKSCNMKKLENKLRKINLRLNGIRHNYLHQTTSEIVNRKPMFIVLENLNVKGMIKNKHLAKSIQEQSFYEFYRQIEYKCLWNNIKFIIADRFYPSSKTCSRCSAIKKDLKLSDRTYICPECGLVIDRDKNASINLMKYGQLAINQ
ncbi:transposase [Clostridium senegalense]|uniref:RNA-guided endonuclease InsQ/TnpB family protein n=1 Tax=Clostridium senegalense TaxID=1465809 RepID=UPI001C10DDE5|nr:RNA-guided endonuclease TnpB family protein [Clostridium senegalense]MBU5228109.1 transposase [Clostridium senegalense]